MQEISKETLGEKCVKMLQAIYLRPYAGSHAYMHTCGSDQTELTHVHLDNCALLRNE